MMKVQLFNKNVQVTGTNVGDGDFRDHAFVEKYCIQHDIDQAHLVLPIFQHHTEVAVVRGVSKKPLHVDAVITNRKQIVLGMRVADCLPIVVYDKKRQILATIHGSWRTLMQHIVSMTLSKLCNEFGSNPEDCYVWIGPSIQKCCYVVEKDCSLSKIPDWKSFLQTDNVHTDKVHVDLQGFCIKQCCDAGVIQKNITVMPDCTFHDKTYFSHRRSVMTNNPQDDGRMAVFAWMTQ